MTGGSLCNGGAGGVRRVLWSSVALLLSALPGCSQPLVGVTIFATPEVSRAFSEGLTEGLAKALKEVLAPPGGTGPFSIPAPGGEPSEASWLGYGAMGLITIERILSWKRKLTKPPNGAKSV